MISIHSLVWIRWGCNMMDIIDKISTFLQQTQILWAVLLGMWIQFWFDDKKNTKLFLSITVASIFVSLYIVPALLDIINAITTRLFSFEVGPSSNIAIMIYASSSLISMELLAILIKVLPKGAERKFMDYLGVIDGDNTNEKQVW